jgi:hypothetical protein
LSKPHACPFCQIPLKDPLKHIGKCQIAAIMLDPRMEAELNRLRTGDADAIIRDTMKQWTELYQRTKGRPPSQQEYEGMRATAVRNLNFIRSTK